MDHEKYTSLEVQVQSLGGPETLCPNSCLSRTLQPVLVKASAGVCTSCAQKLPDSCVDGGSEQPATAADAAPTGIICQHGTTP